MIRYILGMTREDLTMGTLGDGKPHVYEYDPAVGRNPLSWTSQTLTDMQAGFELEGVEGGGYDLPAEPGDYRIFLSARAHSGPAAKRYNMTRWLRVLPDEGTDG